MINYLNEMIASFFYRDRQAMKFSSNKMVLFIAKCKLSVPIFVWIIAIVGFIERVFFNSNYLSKLPNNELLAVLIILTIYFPLNKYTWKIDEIIQFVNEENNEFILKKRFRQYFILVGIGALIMLYIGYYNKWHPLP